MKVRYIPRAQDDVDEIYESIAAGNPNRAQRVEDAIRAAAELLGRKPGLVLQRGMKMRGDGRCPNTHTRSSIALIGMRAPSTCCVSLMEGECGT
jgi:plasmid stabilization system protein ParE